MFTGGFYVDKSAFLTLAVLVAAGWVANAHADLGPQTQASSVDICPTCTSLQDAVNYVLSDVAAKQGPPGFRTVEVINPTSQQTFFVEYKYFPINFPVPAEITANVGTTADNFVAATALAAQDKALVLNITPASPLYDTYAFDTLRDWTPETLWPQVNLLWLTQNVELKDAEGGLDFKIIEAAILYYFGHGPKVTVVFSDGSTGQFYFSPSASGAITYINGSGMNPNGTPYNMGTGSGGGGGEGDYLKPFSGGGGFYLDIEDDYWSCSEVYENSKPYYACVESK